MQNNFSWWFNARCCSYSIAHTHILFTFVGFSLSLFSLVCCCCFFFVTKLKWVRSFFRRQKIYLSWFQVAKKELKYCFKQWQMKYCEMCAPKKINRTDISCKLQFICTTVIFYLAISLATFYQYPFRFSMRMATQHFFFPFCKESNKMPNRFLFSIYIECQRSMFRLL